MFWITVLIFAALLFGTVYLSLQQSTNFTSARKLANAKLRGLQLEEVESELRGGEINEQTAQSMRLEAERAYQRAERKLESDVSTAGPKWAIWVVVAGCFLGALLLYSRIGLPEMPDLPFAEQAELRRPPQERAYDILEENGSLADLPKPDAQTQELVDALEDRMLATPDDPQGWEYLARISYSTENYRRAYQAQQEYLNLIGSNATADDYSFLAESMILSVNGYISPEAEDALRQSLRINPQNRVGRYYAALTMIQNDEVENGRTLLQKLREDVGDDPAWTQEIERRLAETEPAKGPSEEDIQNAAEMSDEERQDMIGGMVDGLKARLAESGGTPEEWVRLINALRVLGRDNEANAIQNEAKGKFPDDPAIQSLP